MIIESWTLMAFLYLTAVTIAWPVLVSFWKLFLQQDKSVSNSFLAKRWFK